MLNTYSSTLDIVTLADFVNERQALDHRKTYLEGKTPPPEYAAGFPLVEPGKNWTLKPFHVTDDKFFQANRFCCVFRQRDRVSTWFRQNVLTPFADHEYLWLMCAINRVYNWPPTIRMLISTDGAWPSYPNFDPTKMTAAIAKWKAAAITGKNAPNTMDDMLKNWAIAGSKAENAAYRIRAESNKSKPWYSWGKDRYLCEKVLGDLWTDRAKLMSFFDTRPTMSAAWGRLKQYHWWGPFYTGQWTSDLRHTRYLGQAPDRATWAALGPGSRKGLNLLHGRQINAGKPETHPLAQQKGLEEMRKIQALLPQHLAPWVPRNAVVNGVATIELIDVQNLCCEIAKYLGVKRGVRGTTKVKYVPGRGY